MRLNFRTAALLILGLLAIRIRAQEQVQLEHRFLIRTKTASMKFIGPVHGGTERIRIAVENSSIRPQVIDCLAEDIELLPFATPIRFETADYDGDGFQDFSLRDTRSSAPNEIRHFFFWSPRRLGFFQRQDVQDAGVSVFERGFFHGYWRHGPAMSDAVTYRFHRGRFIPVRTVSRDLGQQLRSIIPHVDVLQVYCVTTIFRTDGTSRTFYKISRP